VAELVDARDSKSRAARHGGSIPSTGTIFKSTFDLLEDFAEIDPPSASVGLTFVLAYSFAQSSAWQTLRVFLGRLRVYMPPPLSAFPTRKSPLAGELSPRCVLRL
jgi:hypothetical protein